MSNMAPGTVKAVFFDLFETLVTEYDPHFRGKPSVAARLGLAEDRFVPAWRRRRDQRMRGEIPDYATCLHQICHELGAQPDSALIRQLQLERAADKGRAFGRIRDDVITMLEALKAGGITAGLISNCLGEEVAAWPHSPLPHLIDPAIFSYQTGYAKPEPEIFQLACRQAGVTPAEAAFVGDGGSDELQGAQRAGLLAFQASWYLDAWPADRRRRRLDAASIPQLATPLELLEHLNVAGGPTG